MAKSYITKFTEYVSEQQENLKSKLKDKGIIASPNATLGSLVANLDNIQENFGANKYERDPNFPDIDAMFDNDPLRVANGGQYKGCCYFIVQIDPNGKIVIPANYNGYNVYYKAIPIEYVFVGNNVVYEGETAGTSNIIYEVPEESIFTDKKGLSYCLVRYYCTEQGIIPGKTGNYANYLWYPTNWVEGIDDYQKAITASLQANTINDIIEIKKEYHNKDYLRHVFSLTTQTDLDSVAPSTSCIYVKCLRIDGLFEYYTFINPYTEKYIFNGTFAGTTLNFGSTNKDKKQIVQDLVLPYTENNVAVNLWSLVLTSLYIPDCPYTISAHADSLGNSSLYTLKKIHYGNKLTTVLPSTPYSLEELTLSNSAFGLNETAITLDLSYYAFAKEMVLNIFECLADRTGMTANIIKLSPFSKAFLSDEEKAILTNKNWTLS